MDNPAAFNKTVLVGLVVKSTGAFRKWLKKTSQTQALMPILLGAVSTVFGLVLQTAPPLGLHSRSCDGPVTEIGCY